MPTPALDALLAFVAPHGYPEDAARRARELRGALGPEERGHLFGFAAAQGFPEEGLDAVRRESLEPLGRLPEGYVRAWGQGLLDELRDLAGPEATVETMADRPRCRSLIRLGVGPYVAVAFLDDIELYSVCTPAHARQTARGLVRSLLKAVAAGISVSR